MQREMWSCLESREKRNKKELDDGKVDLNLFFSSFFKLVIWGTRTKTLQQIEAKSPLYSEDDRKDYKISIVSCE